MVGNERPPDSSDKIFSDCESSAMCFPFESYDDTAGLILIFPVVRN